MEPAGRRPNRRLTRDVILRYAVKNGRQAEFPSSSRGCCCPQSPGRLFQRGTIESSSDFHRGDFTLTEPKRRSQFFDHTIWHRGDLTNGNGVDHCFRSRFQHFQSVERIEHRRSRHQHSIVLQDRGRIVH